MLQELTAYIGPAAGVATSLLWTTTSLFFTAAGRRIGPTTVNGTRIALAVVLLGITHRLLAGTWLPEASTRQVLLLAASGIVGLTIGDQALFTSFLHVGPRIAMLVMTTSPLFAALFGYLALGEVLHGVAWVGMAMVIAGVAWVVLERPPANKPDVRQLPAQAEPGAADANARGAASGFPAHRGLGLALAALAAACQAGGLLLSKQGMGHGWLPPDQRLDPQAATLVRMVFAGVGIAPVLILHGLRQRRRAARGIHPHRFGSRRAGFLFAAGGAVVGPFLGVWMSLVASDRAPLGIAQTLCSLPPIFILPFAATIYKEHIGLRAIGGAVVAVAGAALLFFQGS